MTTSQIRVRFTSVIRIFQKCLLDSMSWSSPNTAFWVQKRNILVSFNNTICIFQYLIIYPLGSMRTQSPCNRIFLDIIISPKSLSIEDIQEVLDRHCGWWREIKARKEHPPWEHCCLVKPAFLNWFPILVHNCSCKLLRLYNVPFHNVTHILVIQEEPSDKSPCKIFFK